MKRDYILVCGNQGFGKSAWTMTYGRGKTRLFVFDPKAEYPANFYWQREELDAILDGNVREFRIGSSYPDELELLANSAYGVTDCALILEECAFLFDRGERLEEWAHRIVYMGREPKLDFVLVAQRANAVPIDVRSQASRIVVFNQTEPADVKALGDRIGREWCDVIPKLAELECLDWERGQVARYSISHPKDLT